MNQGLPNQKPLSAEEMSFLRGLSQSEDAPQRVKSIERTTNHDVKAVEYYITEMMEKAKMGNQSLVHFGCTSEDINNLSYGLILKDARESVILPTMTRLVDQLRQLAHQLADSPLLSLTHGQPATPTTMGKELANFTWRLEKEAATFKRVSIMGKLNGAVGNYNAFAVSYADVEWPSLTQEFIEQRLGICHAAYSTQIECHDYIAELCDSISRFNRILLDFVRDIWQYISRSLFTLKKVESEVGSSTMPHKINPIDFENCEGNLGLANAILHHLSEKLPVSRLQRDLSDSTVLRSVGVGFAYALIAYTSCLQGLGKIELKPAALAAELDPANMLLGEAIQTVLRKNGVANAYERLKALTRGEDLQASELKSFIESLRAEIEDPQDFERLMKLTPKDYVGLAPFLARSV